MTSYIAHTVIDCTNAYELSTWWKQVLGYVDLPDDPNEPGHSECIITPPDDPARVLLFQQVPDDKSVKNRLHFDVRPHTGTRDQEVERVVGLGGIEIDDQRNHYGPGIGWVVMRDPEGNEFCILRSAEEMDANPMSSD